MRILVKVALNRCDTRDKSVNCFNYYVTAILKRRLNGLLGLINLYCSIGLFMISILSTASKTNVVDCLRSRYGAFTVISAKPCSNALGQVGTCMFMWDCIKTEGVHLGTCSDRFLFGSCCYHNSTGNDIDPQVSRPNSTISHSSASWAGPTTTAIAEPISVTTPSTPSLISTNDFLSEISNSSASPSNSISLPSVISHPTQNYQVQSTDHKPVITSFLQSSNAINSSLGHQLIGHKLPNMSQSHENDYSSLKQHGTSLIALSLTNYSSIIRGPSSNYPQKVSTINSDGWSNERNVSSSANLNSSSPEIYQQQVGNFQEGLIPSSSGNHPSATYNVVNLTTNQNLIYPMPNQIVSSSTIKPLAVAHPVTDQANSMSIHHNSSIQPQRPVQNQGPSSSNHSLISQTSQPAGYQLAQHGSSNPSLSIQRPSIGQPTRPPVAGSSWFSRPASLLANAIFHSFKPFPYFNQNRLRPPTNRPYVSGSPSGHYRPPHYRPYMPQKSTALLVMGSQQQQLQSNTINDSSGNGVTNLYSNIGGGSFSQNASNYEGNFHNISLNTISQDNSDHHIVNLSTGDQPSRPPNIQTIDGDLYSNSQKQNHYEILNSNSSVLHQNLSNTTNVHDDTSNPTLTSVHSTQFTGAPTVLIHQPIEHSYIQDNNSNLLGHTNENSVMTVISIPQSGVLNNKTYTNFYSNNSSSHDIRPAATLPPSQVAPNSESSLSFESKPFENLRPQMVQHHSLLHEQQTDDKINYQPSYPVISNFLSSASDNQLSSHSQKPNSSFELHFSTLGPIDEINGLSTGDQSYNPTPQTRPTVISNTSESISLGTLYGTNKPHQQTNYVGQTLENGVHGAQQGTSATPMASLPAVTMVIEDLGDSHTVTSNSGITPSTSPLHQTSYHPTMNTQPSENTSVPLVQSSTATTFNANSNNHGDSVTIPISSTETTTATMPAMIPTSMTTTMASSSNGNIKGGAHETSSVLSSASNLNNNGKEVACGVTALYPQTKVVGGKNAAFGAWPWQVSVRKVSFFGFSSTHRCGGAVISSEWIATAGHCVEDLALQSIRIRVGEYDFSSLSEPYPYIERAARRKVVHPKYNFYTYENDLALVQLDQPIIFPPHIAPICLPPDNIDLLGRNATVTGWGRLNEGGTLPTILQEVRVPIVSNDKCKNMFLNAGRPEYIPDIFLCAGYEEGGRDSCQGDSGGPLQVKGDDGKWFLAGIISWGIGCAEQNLPGVCTRISRFKLWIQSTMGSSAWKS